MTGIKTALFDNHVARKGKMVTFGGFDLPVWFSNLKDEHMAVRQDAGCFDISHMGFVEVTGEGAFEFLQKLSTNDANKMMGNKMIYSMILNEKGGIMDDIMFGRIDEKTFVVVVNAGNRPKINAWIAQMKPANVTCKELNADHSFIAIQGPNAVAKLEKVTGLTLTDKPRFSVGRAQIMEKDAVLMRTGYTGEDGFEVLVPNAIVNEFWDALIAAGVTPCGLGCRDSLRIEFGLPLYGQELNENITPLNTRYKWAVKMETDFIGKPALEAQQKNGVELVTVGLEMNERVIPRSHYTIKEGGEVTSGTLSPMLDKPIAMAFVKPEFGTVGSTVHVEIRGAHYPAKVVEVPFK